MPARRNLVRNSSAEHQGRGNTHPPTRDHERKITPYPMPLLAGRRQLIVYRAFFEPGVYGWPEHACRGCSFVADEVVHVAHLQVWPGSRRSVRSHWSWSYPEVLKKEAEVVQVGRFSRDWPLSSAGHRSLEVEPNDRSLTSGVLLRTGRADKLRKPRPAAAPRLRRARRRHPAREQQRLVRRPPRPPVARYLSIWGSLAQAAACPLCRRIPSSREKRCCESG
jgi:Bacterial protein of unknown function (DUF899)